MLQGFQGLGCKVISELVVFKPCTQKVSTLAPKYLYRDSDGPKVYTVWVHGLLRFEQKVG